MKTGAKLVISVVWDLLDFTIGRVPVIGTLFDVGGTTLALYLYGTRGLLAGLEIFEVTEQLDSWIPSLTLLGLYELWEKKRR